MRTQLHTISRTLGAFTLASTLLLTTSACGAVTRSVVDEATPAAIESGIESASKDKNQQAIVDAIDPQRVEQATQKMASGATDGFIKALEDKERQQRIANALSPIVGSLVDQSMQSALSDANLARVRELAKQATLGFQDAVDEVDEQKKSGEIPKDKGNVLDAADKVAEGGDLALYGLLAAVALLLLLIIAGTWFALRRKQKYEVESAKRDSQIKEVLRLLHAQGVFGDEESNGSQTAQVDADETEHLRQALQRLRDGAEPRAPS